jgi:heat shock protein HslJ
VDVAGLVGSWSVTTTATAADTILVLHPDGFALRGGPAVRYGSWRADSSGLFVAHVTGASGDARIDMSTPPWLEAATFVTAATGDRLLLDAAGRTTAQLSPRAWPPPASGPTWRPGPAAPLPAGLEPAEHSRLVGRWEIADDGRAAPTPQPPHVDLAAGGAWTGTDGCNNAAGRWTSGPAGALLATSGPMTLMGCAGVAQVPSWLGQTARAGLDGATLVLLDADGRELGRLVRGPVAGSARLAPLSGG